MNRKIFALLVGIDTYPQPVFQLHGCVNDVTNLHDYLKENFKVDLRVETLLNSDATRENIIRLFRRHLCKAGKEDVVLFHYSGHGSNEIAAPGFKEFFPVGKNETLVCYDSRLDNGLDLADKELAVLLWEVAQKQPHLAVTLDCCHSGSGTRAPLDTGLTVRRTSPDGNNTPRPIETYLDGYYSRMESISIPRSRHVLMAACDRNQEACESQHKTGLFTTTLLEVLTGAKGNISYADLFTRCRAEILKYVSDQTPQFETYRQFMSYLKFLDMQLLETRQRFHVYFEDAGWEMDGGAVHGIPHDPEKKVEVALYPYPVGKESPVNRQTAGYARVQRVEAQKSTLELFFNADQDRYKAEIISLPVPSLPVYLEGDEERKRVVTKKMALPGAGFAFTGEPRGAKYILSVDNKRLLLFRKENRALIQGAEGDMEAAAAYMNNVLEKIVRWERALSLKNKESYFNPDDVDVKFFEILGDSTQWPHKGNQITLDFIKAGDDWKDIEAKLKVRNRTSRELHFTLIYFSRNYGITALYNDTIPAESGFVTVWGEGEDDQFYLPDDVDETEDRFMLIASTERVDDFLLNQEGVEAGEIKAFHGTRGKKDIAAGDIGSIGSRKKLKITNDWFTKTLTVKTVRQMNRVSINDTFRVMKKGSGRKRRLKSAGQEVEDESSSR
jgi:hypothetical protein